MSEKIIISKEVILPIFNKTNSINKTAQELGIGWSTCKRILQEYGVQTQPKNGSVDNFDLFRCITTEEDAYWLGIMYTDGWVRSDKNKIGLGSVDKDLIEKFKAYTKTSNIIQIYSKEKFIGKSLPGGRICKTAQDFYEIEFSSKQTKENLKKMGCMPKKSLILQCPTEDQVSDELLWHFFRGCVDGDGYVRCESKFAVGLLGTQHFLEVLTSRLRINHYGYLRKKENSEVWEFTIYKKELVIQVLNKMYNNCSIYMNRKFERYMNFLGRSSI